MHDNLDPKSVQSLARLVGFSSSPVKMGVVRKSRILQEAVVAVPYILETAPSGQQAVPRFLQLDKLSVLRHLVETGIISREEAIERAGDLTTQNEEPESTDDVRRVAQLIGGGSIPQEASTQGAIIEGASYGDTS